MQLRCLVYMLPALVSMNSEEIVTTCGSLHAPVSTSRHGPCGASVLERAAVAGGPGQQSAGGSAGRQLRDAGGGRGLVHGAHAGQPVVRQPQVCAGTNDDGMFCRPAVTQVAIAAAAQMCCRFITRQTVQSGMSLQLQHHMS